MAIWAPPVLVVSEDGMAKTAGFALRLTSAPLSAVTVTLTSSRGSVRLSPRVVTFDYLNFSSVLNVTAFGVDDSGQLFFSEIHF